MNSTTAPPARPRTVVLLALVGLGLLPAAPGRAQDGDDEHEGRTYQVGDADDLRRGVDDFERHVKRGDWELAARALQDLLDVPPEHGLVVRVQEDGPPRYVGAGHMAQRLFDQMPADARAAWEQAYRQEAEELLDRGVRLRRDSDLAEAARRFPADDVRRRALDARARLAFARGDFAAARFVLGRLRSLAEDDDQRAEITARIAFAAAQSGDRQAVDRLAAVSGTLLARDVPGGDGAVSLRTFLERMAAAAGPPTAEGGWPQFGGTANGLPDRRPLPVLENVSSWDVPTGFDEGSQTYADRSRRNELEHRPIAPVISRDVMYVNSGLAVSAVEMSSGRLVWTYLGPHRDADWRDNQHMVHGAAVEGDVVYAAVASRSDAPDMVRRFYGHPIVYPLPHRTLVALDVRSGDVLWSHDDAALARSEHPDADAISQESVACPPIVVGDDLLVTTWRWDSLFSVRVVCFDRRTGLTRWRRTVALGQQELNLFGRAVKELATTALAARDGNVYVGTNLGVVAALERDDGDILWLTTYPQTRLPRSDYWYQTAERPVTWRPGPVVTTPQHLVLAPTESPFLLCIDRETGRIVWMRGDQQRGLGNDDWFLGVQDGRAYTLGSRLSAIDVATGQPAFKRDGAGRLRNESGMSRQATGAGVLGKDAVLVPAGDDLLRLDPKTGLLLASEDFAGAEGGGLDGNLLAADGVLLDISQSQILAYYDPESRRQELLLLLAQQPNDPHLRLRAGEVFRRTGHLDDAVSSLRVGLRNVANLAPQARHRIEDPLRRALYDALIDRAEQHRSVAEIEAAIADYESAADAARDPADAAMALFRQATIASRDTRRKALERIIGEFGAERVAFPEGRRHAGAYAAYLLGDEFLARGEIEAALAIWLDILERHADEDLGKSDVRGSVHQRLARQAERHPNQVRKAVRERAERALAAAREAADPAALDRVARLYPDEEGASEAALLAARLHVEAGDPRQAVIGLRGMLGTAPSSPTAARLLLALADAYRSFDDPASERGALTRLARDHAEADVDGRRAGDVAAERLADPRLAGPVVELPRPEPPLEKLWERKGHGQAPRIVSVDGRRPDGLEDLFVATLGDTLLGVRAADGETAWRTPIGSDLRMGVIGHRDVLVVGGSERGVVDSTVLLEGVRAHDGLPMWSRRLVGRLRSQVLGEGVLFVLWRAAPDAAGDASYRLSAIELGGGQVAAERELEGPVGENLLVCDDSVVLFRTIVSGGRAQRVAEILDGATLSLRGRVEYEAAGSHRLATAIPERPIVVAVSGPTQLVGIDVHTGATAWSAELGDVPVSTLLPVPGGIIAVDGAAGVRRISADGEVQWSADLGALGTYAFGGSEAADGVVVVPVVQGGSPARTTVVALDAGSGDELWRREIELSRRAMPRTSVTYGHVAVEINENLGRGTWSSRVVFLDRETGAVVWVLEDPELSQSFLKVRYDRGWVVLATLGTGGAHVAVYGRR